MANPRMRDICLGVLYQCVAPCPRVRGLGRGDVARLLREGNLPHGVAPASRLVWEATYRAERRAEQMDQTIAGLEERIRELQAQLAATQAQLAPAQAQLAAAHAMRGNTDRLVETLRGFAPGGGGAPTPAPRQSQQPESEPAASERGD